MLLTPRFRASRHVVALVLRRGTSQPSLVLKIARLADDPSGVAREAAILRELQAARAHGFDTIPRVIAQEQWLGRALLVETALVGRPLSPLYARRRPARAVAAVLAWLAELPTALPASPLVHEDVDSRFERLVQQPLEVFGRSLPEGDEIAAVERTLTLLAPLQTEPIGPVVEHGDLSHPNLLLLASGGVGVVDWELAEPQGFPAHDLFVFLAYVAVARARAVTVDRQVDAVFHALGTPRGWLKPYAAAYATARDIERGLLGPLFLACWARIIAGRLQRLLGDTGPAAASPELAAWIRQDRYYLLWRHTLDRIAELHW